MIATRLSAATLVASWDGENLHLTAEPTRVELQVPESLKSLSLAEEAKAKRFTLVVRGLAADPDPQTGYLVFLNLPENARPSMDNAGFVGTISFFGAPKVPPKSADERGRSVSFEISKRLVRLGEAGLLKQPLTVTFVPAGPPAEGSRPSVARVAVYEN